MLGTVPVRLLSNTDSFSPVRLSSGGRLPVNAFRDTSRNVSDATDDSTAGSVPFSPVPLSVMACTPASVGPVTQRCHDEVANAPSWHEPPTPAQLCPYATDVLAFCAGLVYGAHGCQPRRQLGSSAPLGSSAAAAALSVVNSGWLRPMLVPVRHPVPAAGTLLPVGVEAPTSYVKLFV